MSTESASKVKDALDHETVRAFIEEKTLKPPFAIKLHDPITLGSEILEVIEFDRKPTIGDYEYMPIEKQTFSDHATVLSKVSGHALAIIKRMSGPDFSICQEVNSYFFAGSDRTSKDT